jgi:hypothetical protein
MRMLKPTVQVAIALFVLLLTGKIFADVYVYKNKDGKLVFSNVPTHQGFRRVVREKDLPDARKKENGESTNFGDGSYVIPESSRPTYSNQPTNQPGPEEEGRLHQIFRDYEVPVDAIIERARWNEIILSARQWKWKKDTNGDGKVTISDVPGWIEWAVYYPGDWAIYELLKKPGSAAEFLELTPASYGGNMSLIISLVAFLLVLVLYCFLLALEGFLTNAGATQQAASSGKQWDERMRKEYGRLSDKGLWKWLFNR